MKHACAKFRVFLLDQRGTGLSDAITTSTLLRHGDARAQADYLSHFRCCSSRAGGVRRRCLEISRLTGRLLGAVPSKLVVEANFGWAFPRVTGTLLGKTGQIGLHGAFVES